ncbi:hypothetical protein ARGLB_064_01260, partial [Arthrobacter globiformis NBRC 12137]
MTDIWGSGRAKAGILTLLSSVLAVVMGLAGFNAVTPAHAADSDYLDQSFANRGLFTHDFGGVSGPGPVAVDVDTLGRTVTAGRVQTLVASDWRVIRLLPSGQPDPTFGEAGVITLASQNSVTDLRIQADGKILLAGNVQVPGVGGSAAVIRLDDRGLVDTTFASSGMIVPEASTAHFAYEVSFDALTFSPEGSVVIAGSIKGSSAAWKYSADGFLDSTFAELIPDPQGSLSGWGPEDITVDAVGRVTVAGAYEGHRGALVRYLPDGSADTSFGINGVLRNRTAGAITNVAAYKDGSVVAASYKRLAAYNTSGVELPDLAAPGELVVTSLLVDGSNNLLVGGWNNSQGPASFTLMKFAADRSVAQSFGTAGVVATAFPQGNAFLSDMALTPDGHLAGAGWVNSFSNDPNNPNDSGLFALARYDLSFLPPPTFPPARSRKV